MTHGHNDNWPHFQRRRCWKKISFAYKKEKTRFLPNLCMPKMLRFLWRTQIYMKNFSPPSLPSPDWVPHVSFVTRRLGAGGGGGLCSPLVGAQNCTETPAWSETPQTRVGCHCGVHSVCQTPFPSPSAPSVSGIRKFPTPAVHVPTPVGSLWQNSQPPCGPPLPPPTPPTPLPRSCGECDDVWQASPSSRPAEPVL